MAPTSPQCPLTRELENAFENIARQLHPDVSVGKIDGAVERGLLARFQVGLFGVCLPASVLASFLMFACHTAGTILPARCCTAWL